MRGINRGWVIVDRRLCVLKPPEATGGSQNPMECSRALCFLLIEYKRVFAVFHHSPIDDTFLD